MRVEVMDNIRFRRINTVEEKVYLDGTYLGKTKHDIWKQKWTLQPCFKIMYSDEGYLHSKYDSWYDAGKALVQLYKMTFNRIDEKSSLDDTDEFDVKDVFKNWGP
jgi:hypothetical protein